jgi:hypothetical protein
LQAASIEHAIGHVAGSHGPVTREYEYVTYPGQGHAFAGAALGRSRSTTIEFMSAIL